MKDMNKPRNHCSLTGQIRRIQAQPIHPHMLPLFVFTLLITFFLIGNSIITFANAKSNRELHKYYMSVQLQNGDSLWSLANKYASNGTNSREEFIHEVCRINGISENNTLHSGDYLIVSYYSSENPQPNTNE